MGYQCNNNCLFCATGTSNDGLTTDEIITFIDEHLCHGGDVVFTGGEPTIRKDFIEIVKYTKDTYNAGITILTNSTMFADVKFADEICGYIDMAQCSFYAHEAKLHDYIVQNQGSYEKTVAGIQSLLDHGVSIHVRTLINLRHTFRLMPDLTKSVNDLFGVDNIWYSGLDLCGNLLSHPKAVVKLQTAEYYLEKAIEMARDTNMKPHIMFYPLCLLSQYHRSLVHPISLTSVIKSYISDDCESAEEKNYDYAFGKRCRSCTQRNRCPGVWSNYLSKYGDYELDPIR